MGDKTKKKRLLRHGAEELVPRPPGTLGHPSYIAIEYGPEVSIPVHEPNNGSVKPLPSSLACFFSSCPNPKSKNPNPIKNPAKMSSRKSSINLSFLRAVFANCANLKFQTGMCFQQSRELEHNFFYRFKFDATFLPSTGAIRNFENAAIFTRFVMVPRPFVAARPTRSRSCAYSAMLGVARKTAERKKVEDSYEEPPTSRPTSRPFRAALQLNS